jgi:hypothetical protein
MNLTIKDFLNTYYPNSETHSIFGKYNLRFELGGKHKNGTLERTNQATIRALDIFERSIGFRKTVVVIQHFENEFYDRENHYINYLFELLDKDHFEIRQGPFDSTYYETNPSGEKVEKIWKDHLECDLYIGEIDLNKKTTESLIRGKVNLEMGMEPKIPQIMFFYSIDNQIGFRIYDDRGCDVWSNQKEKLYPIYRDFDDYILEYNRQEIEEYFE